MSNSKACIKGEDHTIKTSRFVPGFGGSRKTDGQCLCCRLTLHISCPESGNHVQASHLYLLLCFSPQTLHSDGQLMRTLVDRHFSDNWVVSWGLGCTTDLAVEWDSFRAARSALSGVVSVSRARDIGAAIKSSLPDMLKQLAAHTSKTHLSVSFLILLGEVSGSPHLAKS